MSTVSSLYFTIIRLKLESFLYKKKKSFCIVSGICTSEREEEAKAEETQFGCNISHLSRYSGIAEKSMENFVSVISSFRYNSSGSRASGLRRPPLKDIKNNCMERYKFMSIAKIIITRRCYRGTLILYDFGMKLDTCCGSKQICVCTHQKDDCTSKRT